MSVEPGQPQSPAEEAQAAAPDEKAAVEAKLAEEKTALEAKLATEKAAAAADLVARIEEALAGIPDAESLKGNAEEMEALNTQGLLLMALYEECDGYKDAEEVAAAKGELEQAIAKLQELMGLSAQLLEEKDENAVAVIGETPYEEFAAAIKAANENGGVVTLVKSTTASITVTGTFTLVIPEGVTLTNEAGKHTITVAKGGHLTIDGAGVVDNVSHAKAALLNQQGGTVDEIKGSVTFTRSAEAGKDNKDNGGNSFYTVQNQGTIGTISGGTFENKGFYSAMMSNGDGLANGQIATITSITGGTFTGGNSTLKNSIYGIITSIGGTDTASGPKFISNNPIGIVILNYHTISMTNTTIQGGSWGFVSGYGGGSNYTVEANLGSGVAIESPNASVVAQSPVAAPENASVSNTINITGGAYTKTVGYVSSNTVKQKIVITGGTFSGNISSYVASGYKQAYDTGVVSNNLNVRGKNDYAAIGDNYYTTLQAAIDAAKSDDVVRYLGAQAYSSPILISGKSNITIDGGGLQLVANTKYSTFTQANAHVLKIESSNGVTVKNLCVEGRNGASTSKNNGNAINVYCSDNVTLENVTAKNAGKAGLVVNASNVKVIGKLNLSGNECGGIINVGFGSGINGRDGSSLDASQATLSGVQVICADANDVNNAGGKDKFVITVPNGWYRLVDPDSNIGGVSYVQEVYAKSAGVAKVGNVYYTTLQEAINVGGTVTLLKSTNESVLVGDGKTVILTIPKDVTLTNKAEGHTITVANGGRLTIGGEGTVDNKSHQKAALYVQNGGTVAEIKGNLTFKRSKEAGRKGEGANGNSWYTISNEGTIEKISGGTFENTGTFSSMFNNGWSYTSEAVGKKAVIKEIAGGTFTGGTITLKNSIGGEIGRIDGATFVGSPKGTVNFIVILNYETIGSITNTTITGSGAGICNGYAYDPNNMQTGNPVVTATLGEGVRLVSAVAPAVRILVNQNAPEDVSVTTKITGGEYYVQYAASGITAVGFDARRQKPAITGGTFSGDVSGLVASGYVQNSKGKIVPQTEYKFDFKLSQLMASVKLGGTLQLGTIGLSGEKVEWKSSNENIATVDSTGKVTAGSSAGTAVVTASANGISKSCIVKVQGIRLADGQNAIVTAKTVYAGDTFTLKLADSVEASQTATWASNNNKVTVSASGTSANITAATAGTAVITATVGGGTAQCTVTVLPKQTAEEKKEMVVVDSVTESNLSVTEEVREKVAEATTAVIAQILRIADVAGIREKTQTQDEAVKAAQEASVKTAPVDETTLKKVVEALDAGKEVKPEVSAVSATQEMAADAVAKTAEERENLAKASGKEVKVALVLDINLKLVAKQGSGQGETTEELGNIKEMDDEVPVFVKLPQELQQSGRVFHVIRVHDGVVDVLDTKYDETTGNVIIETDRFSPYTLVYEDQVKAPAAAPGGSSQSDDSDDSDDSSDSAPAQTAPAAASAAPAAPPAAANHAAQPAATQHAGTDNAAQADQPHATVGDEALPTSPKVTVEDEAVPLAPAEGITKTSGKSRVIALFAAISGLVCIAAAAIATVLFKKREDNE